MPGELAPAGLAGLVRHAAWERWTFATWSGGWRVTRALPEPVVARAFAGMADLAWARRGAGVRQLETNLTRVLASSAPAGSVPDALAARVREVSRAGMRSYLRYWSETFRLPDWSPDRIRSAFRIVDERPMRDALAAGTGVVIAMPHMANWDLAGAWAGLEGLPVTTVAERLRPERLFQQFLAYRETLGLEIIPLTGGDADVFGCLVDRLRDNHVVPLLADRDLRASGVEVSFFGAPARMPTGPALLSLRTGASLVPASLCYDDTGVRMTLYDAVVDPGTGTTRHRAVAMTQQVADAMAVGIAAHPADWHMMQPLWLADLAPRGDTRA